MGAGKALRAGALVLCAAIMVVSGINIYRIKSEYKKGEDTYQALEEYVRPHETQKPVYNTTNAQTNMPTNTEEKPTENAETLPPPQSNETVDVNFDALVDINSDCVGWLYLPQSAINYPVVRGEDNEYYLTHMFNGDENSGGCLFEDYRCGDILGRSIIYGHHMKNGTMFGELVDYKSQTYYESHKNIYYITPDGQTELAVFAAYVADDFDDAWKLFFADDEQQQAWLDEICEKSCIATDILPTIHDKIVTLSTCSYEFENAKFVVFAVEND